MNIRNGFIVILTSMLLACGGGGGGGEGGGDDGNNAPEIKGKPAAVARAGDEYTFWPEVSDADGNQLTFSIDNAPDWLFFDAGSGALTGYPEKRHYGKHEDVVISVFDGSARASLTFSIDVLPPLLGRNNFDPEGTVTITPDGYRSEGTLVLNIDGEEKHFEDSDLLLSFDEEGNLIEMAGETIVPQAVSDNLSLDVPVTATVGMLSGAEINANPDFGITLKDEINYFVYHFGAGLDVGITTGEQRDGSGSPGQLTLSTPLGGEILLITDPSDVFYYYFADLPVIGNAGRGDSVHGFIPFVPALDYAELDSFDGHILDKTSFGVGVKIFDFLNISGTRVIRLPISGKIDFDDLFASPVEFNMGMNGQADFALSILGVGLFEFPVASSSATVSVGLHRQHMAMQTIVAPDVSWQPDWFTILPTTEIVGNWSVDGNGEFSAELSGDYESTLPAAAMSGTMRLDNNGTTFTATIPDAIVPISVSAAFLNEKTTFLVDAEVDISDSISAEVNQAFDQIVDDKLQAFDDLQMATENYEIEVSLRGLRALLPDIADNVISTLNGLPSAIASSVYDQVHAGIKAKQVTIGICSISCARVPSNSAINGYATTASNSARSHTQSRIVPYKSAMQELKLRASQADDEQLREALEQALRTAYNHRRLQGTVSGTIDLPSPVPNYSYSKSYNYDILGANAAKILQAANNVHRIQATSDIKIAASEFYDRIPVDQAVNQARQELADGLSQIPAFDGAGMTVSNGSYSAYILLDNIAYGVDDVNSLNPLELLGGVTRKVAEVLSGGG